MRRRLLLIPFLLAIGSACQSTPPLAHAFRSSESLANEVLDAFARKDRTRLEQLALGESEFRDHVWPDLPASRPERNLPFSYVWGDLHQKSRIALATALAKHGGKRYVLKHVTFAGESRYDHYLVHRAAAFDVVDTSNTAVTLRVAGSFLEKDGVWKVFSYVVDE